jgi:hypothetical protein
MRCDTCGKRMEIDGAWWRCDCGASTADLDPNETPYHGAGLVKELWEVARLASRVNPYGSVENATARDTARATIAKAEGRRTMVYPVRLAHFRGPEGLPVPDGN